VSDGLVLPDVNVYRF